MYKHKHKQIQFLMFALFFLFSCSSEKKDTREQVIELLETNGNCDLPCFWGITPGETNWQDAQLWLSEFATIYDHNDSGQSAEYLTYSLSYTIDKEQNPIRQFLIGFKVGEDKIQKIEVLANFSLIGGVEYIAKYWEKYSIREIFRQLGKPDKILLYICSENRPPCFEVLMIYQNQKTAIYIAGSDLPNGRLVCPQIAEGGEIKSIGLSLASSYLEEDGIAFSTGVPLYTAAEYWSTIKDILGIDELEFYERVLSESPACFDVIKNE